VSDIRVSVVKCIQALLLESRNWLMVMQLAARACTS
jgi:hypothetical protein